MTPIDPETTVGAVTLSVADLERSLHYYEASIGLRVLERNACAATLGAGATPLLHLRAVPGARLVRRATGLYHFALRVPSRRDLARVIRHFTETGLVTSGASDHHVSEALYLSDPDGHGIEIYRDRSRSDWYDANGILLGASDPLNVCSILRELTDDEPAWTGLAADTVMGHLHLQVADIAAADHFYIGVLGFERVVAMPSISFVSAGGYHHHIGMNTWAGAGVAAPPDGAARLLQYEILLPTARALHTVVDRIRGAGLPLEERDEGRAVRDPSHNLVVLRLPTAHA